VLRLTVTEEIAVLDDHNRRSGSHDKQIIAVPTETFSMESRGGNYVYRRELARTHAEID
jgi:hypothetical protein